MKSKILVVKNERFLRNNHPREKRTAIIHANNNNFADLVKKYSVFIKCSTEIISDPFQALQLLESHKYDMVVCDCKMPGMNGRKLLRELRRRDNDIPFILLRSISRKESIIQSLKHYFSRREN